MEENRSDTSRFLRSFFPTPFPYFSQPSISPYTHNMIPSLPLDLLKMILEEVDDGQALARCCLASKIMLDIARPLLYRCIEVLIRSEEWDDDNDDDPPMAFWRHKILEKSNLLLQTLQQYPRLKTCVKHVNYVCTSLWDERRFERIDKPIDIFKQLVAILPNPKTLTLVDPEEFDAVDDIVQKLKGKSGPSLEVHLVLVNWSSIRLDLRNLDGSYASLTLDNDLWSPTKELEGIMSNVPSFKLICSASAGSFCLSKFSKVPHLELLAKAPPTRRPWQKHELAALPLTPLRENLRQHSTLKILVISGSPSPILDQFTSPPQLIVFLPPSVSTLAVRVDIGVDKVVDIVKSLSLDTGIKTIGICYEEGDLRGLRSECEKRGIKLALA
ncbi:hypothetical protein JCM5353_000912 [Sporobolomyces roseus]